MVNEEMMVDGNYINVGDISLNKNYLNKKVFGLKKFALIENSKLPGSGWKKSNWNSMGSILPKQCDNYGIPCGKMNNIMVVDLDFYKFSDLELKGTEFIREFGIDFIAKFNTFTVRTGSGGYHLYFIFDDDISATQNCKHHIDIKSTNGYIVGPGSIVNDKLYKIVLDSDIKFVSVKLKKWILADLKKLKKE